MLSSNNSWRCSHGARLSTHENVVDRLRASGHVAARVRDDLGHGGDHMPSVREDTLKVRGGSATMASGQLVACELLEGSPLGGPSRVLDPGGRTRTDNPPADNWSLCQLSYSGVVLQASRTESVLARCRKGTPLSSGHRGCPLPQSVTEDTLRTQVVERV